VQPDPGDMSAAPHPAASALATNDRARVSATGRKALQVSVTRWLPVDGCKGNRRRKDSRPQSACLLRNTGTPNSSLPLRASASTLAAAWRRCRTCGLRPQVLQRRIGQERLIDPPGRACAELLMVHGDPTQTLDTLSPPRLASGTRCGATGSCATRSDACIGLAARAAAVSLSKTLRSTTTRARRQASEPTRSRGASRRSPNRQAWRWSASRWLRWAWRPAVVGAAPAPDTRRASTSLWRRACRQRLPDVKAGAQGGPLSPPHAGSRPCCGRHPACGCAAAARRRRGRQNWRRGCQSRRPACR